MGFPLRRQLSVFLLDRQQLSVGFCTFESCLLTNGDNCLGKVAGFS